MKAIVTKYHGPTNFKGSRITASDQDGNRITISYPYELSGEACYRKAAQALCNKMKWEGNLIAGSWKHGYVFVFGPDWRRNNSELLSALRALYNCFGDEGQIQEDYQDQLSHALEMAETAIAKAEGK
jgi:hypothetical protein